MKTYGPQIVLAFGLTGLFLLPQVISAVESDRLTDAPPPQMSVASSMRESIVGRSIPRDLLGSKEASRVVVYNGCNSCSKFEIPKDIVKAWGKSAFVIALSSEVSEVGVDVPGRRIEPGHPMYSVLAGVAPTILKVESGVVIDVWLDGRTLEEFDSGSSL